VLRDGPGGVMHEDLRVACLAALDLDRHRVREYAQQFSWSAATAQFARHLTPPAIYEEAA
jgi:hypothetical protein